MLIGWTIGERLLHVARGHQLAQSVLHHPLPTGPGSGRALVGSARALRHSSQRAQAAALVDQAVEQVRANGFGQLNLGIQPLPPVTQDGVTYEGEREILDLTNPATPGHLLKRVRVTVRWKDRKGTNQLVRESWLSALKS